jgi:hypothetical protein
MVPKIECHICNTGTELIIKKKPRVLCTSCHNAKGSIDVDLPEDVAKKLNNKNGNVTISVITKIY